MRWEKLFFKESNSEKDKANGTLLSTKESTRVCARGSTFRTARFEVVRYPQERGRVDCSLEKLWSNLKKEKQGTGAKKKLRWSTVQSL